MKLVTYKYQNTARSGAYLDNQIIDLNRAYKAMLHTQKASEDLAVADARVPTEIIGLLKGGDASLTAVRQALAFVQERLTAAAGEQLASEGLIYAANQVSLLPPVLRPSKVIGVGMNYYAFVKGIEEEVPKYPTLFHKTATALNSHNHPIVIPHVTDEAVPEGEMAVIIGKQGKYITPESALSYVAGYCCANDVCARNLEFRTTQWTSGKMVDTFGPLGPALVTRDEIGDPQSLELKTILNGEVIQAGNTSDMIFSVSQLISEISSITTLEPGDVILTGTPSDLGYIPSPIFLQPGDTISVEVEGVGILTNPVIAEGL